MLSVEQCKKHLPKNLPDQQVIEIRSQFYQLAGILVDKFLQEKRGELNEKEKR